MDSIEITARLLHGSHNLAKMREEIVELVNTLVGFALKSTSNLPGLHEVSETTEATGGQWQVRGNIGNFANPGLHVEFWDRRGGIISLMYDTRQKPSFLRTENVLFVHQNLSMLVRLMLGTFPDLAVHWKPLIEASYVDFDQPLPASPAA